METSAPVSLHSGEVPRYGVRRLPSFMRTVTNLLYLNSKLLFAGNGIR